MLNSILTNNSQVVIVYHTVFIMTQKNSACVTQMHIFYLIKLQCYQHAGKTNGLHHIGRSSQFKEP